MDDLFLLLMFVSFFCLIAGLIKPSLVKLKSRKKSLGVFGSLVIIFFVLFGITSDSTPTPDPVLETKTIQEEKDNTIAENIEIEKTEIETVPEIIKADIKDKESTPSQ